MRAIYNKDFFSHGYLQLNEDGRIGDNERKVFTSGQCHALALAVAKRTGWPFIAVDYEAQSGAAHCGVRLPGTTKILDIKGLHEEADWLSASGSSLVQIDDLDEIKRAWPYTKGGSMHTLTRHAEKFVDAVLAMVE